MTYIAVPTDWDLVCRDLVPTLRQEDRILETRSTKSSRGAEEAQKRRALNKPPAANRRHPSTTTYHLSTSEQHNKQPSNSNVAQDHPVDTYRLQNRVDSFTARHCPLLAAETTRARLRRQRNQAGGFGRPRTPCQIRSRVLGRTYHASVHLHTSESGSLRLGFLSLAGLPIPWHCRFEDRSECGEPG